MERPKLMEIPRISDEELIKQIREMNKSPLCIVPCDEYVNKAILTTDTCAWQDALNILIWNGYKVTAEKVGIEIVLTWKDKENRKE